jgi:hypothetical protein
MAVNKDEKAALDTLLDLESIVTALEGKMEELFMRPRMPYTQDAFVGDKLRLDGNLQPEWTV